MFFIVGPTASGKSDIAAEVALASGGEIVGADAFQVYAGLDQLTVKPDAGTRAKIPHHLIGTMPLAEEMNAERYRTAAVDRITAIQRTGNPVFVVGGSGMYVKALTHGLSHLPPTDPELRKQLTAQTIEQLLTRLRALDPATAETIDAKNKHRMVRALEICLLSGQPASQLRRREALASQPRGVLLFRDRDELYERINSRVESMFANGVVEEVRSAGELSSTSAKTLGLQQIRALIAGEISGSECIAQIQQATRRYAKRQLTWFRGQTNFEPLNLSRYGTSEAIELITRKARLSFASTND